jgi:hypothetical protein
MKLDLYVCTPYSVGRGLGILDGCGLAGDILGPCVCPTGIAPLHWFGYRLGIGSTTVRVRLKPRVKLILGILLVRIQSALKQPWKASFAA